MSFEQARPVSQLTNEFSKRFTASDRIKDIPTDVSRQLLADIKASKVKQTELLAAIAQEGEVLEVVSIDEIDGLRMTLSNGDIVHLRPAGNAPELRCYVESADYVWAQELVKKVVEYNG
jgi:phosphomannomutase